MLTPEQKERIKLLVAALRSGKYRQTKHTLSKYDKKAKKRKFCCLGVACDIAVKNGVELDVRRYGDGYYSYNTSSSELPYSVMDWYGFDHSDPFLIDADGVSRPATRLNDTLGWKYGQIADAFERTYLSDETNTNTNTNTNDGTNK